MAKIKTEDLIAGLKEMTILEINDLVKAIEEEFGVSAAAMASAPVAQEEVEDEGPSEVDVILKAVGDSKLKVVKAIQGITGLGLGDAKKLADVVPSTIKEKVSPEAAKEAKEKLEEAGAQVEVK